MSNVFVGPPTFKDELTRLLNYHSIDARVGMPDFLLADHLVNVVVSLEQVNKRHREWGIIPNGNEEAEARTGSGEEREVLTDSTRGHIPDGSTEGAPDSVDQGAEGEDV